MYQVISLVLALAGLILFFAPDYLIKKDSQNSTLKMIRDYNQIVGVALVGSAYYMYSSVDKKDSTPSTTTEMSTESPEELPSYEKATSE